MSSFGSGAGAALNLESLQELENNLGGSRNRTRGFRSYNEYQNDINAPLEGAITGYNSLKDLKKDRRQGTDYRGYPIRTAEGLYYDVNGNLKYDSKAPKGTITGEESSTILRNNPNWQDYSLGVQPSNTPQFYNGGYLPKAAPGQEVQFPSLASSSVSQDWNPIAQMKINSGDRKARRQTARGIKNFPENFPDESLEDDVNNLEEGEIGPCNEDEVLDPESPCYDPDYKAGEKKYVGVENKVQNIKTFDPEAMLNLGNTGVRAGIGILNNFERKNQQKELYDNNWDSTQVSGVTGRINKGKWNPNSGNSYESTTGNDTLGMGPMAKYGRYMANGGYTEPYNYYTDSYLPQQEELNDDETYMTKEQIQQYVAAGGQIEYI